MELIPILSLIILVATISTFILAVGAYILYKVRERKGKVAEAPEPATIPAEMITPAPLPAETQAAQTGVRSTYYEQQYPTQETGYEGQRQPLFMSTRGTAATAGGELKPTYAPPSTAAYGATNYKSRGTQESFTQEIDKRNKFMRYTSDGYVEPKKNTEKKKKEEKLKWR